MNSAPTHVVDPDATMPDLIPQMDLFGFLRAEALRMREERKITGFQSVMEMTDRILTGLPDLQIKLAHLPPGLPDGTPAWSDGEHVYINRAVLEHEMSIMDMPSGMSSTDLVATFKGLNFHEVAHLMYSPRLGDPINKKLQAMAEGKARGGPNHPDPSWWHAYMALEDQRIETLYTTMYEGVKPFFVLQAHKWLLTIESKYADALSVEEREKFLAKSYTIMAGCKYLHLETRRAVRALFVKYHGMETASKLEALVDAYVVVRYPRDTDLAMRIIAAYRELLLDITDGSPRGIETITGLTACCDNIPTNAMGGFSMYKPSELPTNCIKEGHEDRSEVKEAIEWVKEQMEEEAKAPAPAPAPPSTSQGEAAGHNDGGASMGKPGQGGRSGPLQNALDAIHKEMAQVHGTSEFSSDVKDTLGSVRASAQQVAKVDGEYADFTIGTPSPEDIQTSREILAALTQIRQDQEPRWLHGEPAGRINMNAEMRRQAGVLSLDNFDAWDPGEEDEATIEHVIAIDLSLSMNSHIDADSRALWAIKRACDQVENIRTTVLGYSYGNYVLYQPDDMVDNTEYSSFKVISGTVPDESLRQAFGILDASEASIKVCTFISDGQWSGSKETQQKYIQGMRRLGVITACFVMGPPAIPGQPDRTLRLAQETGMEFYSRIDAGTGVVGAVGGLVTHITQKVNEVHGL